MRLIVKIINNRNFLLILSLTLGLTLGVGVEHLKPYVLWFLAVAMIFSSTSFRLKVLKDYKRFMKITLMSFLLNYVVFGVVLLTVGHLLIQERDLWWGLVVIAATPPGVAIIPFTVMYKGDTDYAMVGVLGVYILAIVVSPLMLQLFVPHASISPWKVVMIMVQVILIPLLLSRLLLWKPIFPTVEKIRGKVVNWAFALIIYTIVGLNRTAIFAELGLLFKLAMVLFAAMFVIGLLYEYLFRRRIDYERRVAQNLMLTIKSSGFAAGTAVALFGERAALPSALLAVFVILYLVTTGFIYNR